MKKIFTILRLLILVSVAVPAPAVVTVAFIAEEWWSPTACGDPFGGCIRDPPSIQASNP